MQLNFKQFGQGEPLLILHGLFGTLDNWQTIAKQLSENFTIFILDQRNHGRSPHLPSHTYMDLAEDLKEFMESQWIYEAHLLGHSMGGKTVMQFALEYPDMVKKLMVLDIAPTTYQGGHETILNALSSLDLATIQDRKEAEVHLAQSVTNIGERQFLLKNLSRNIDGNYEWKMNLPILMDFYDKILANVSGETPFLKKTLFLKGENSNYIQSQNEAEIFKRFPNAAIETIANAGHWLHAEQPQAVVEAIKLFLA